MLRTDLSETPILPGAEQEQKDTKNHEKKIALLVLSFFTSICLIITEE